MSLILAKEALSVSAVTYQLKTLTTAGMSVIMLGTVLSTKQWISLVALSIGVATCQYKPAAATDGPATVHNNEVSCSRI